ncbi:hypothetical protein EYF80_028454 [Liparis tanakae]|uniref:Uncharacterized protein n=1 Tax=Liparis tanakae TaxID=230148 RepID=A0A4Z2H622_9TELE|nr:hypothetical protein EYF80_028454 [Liparis tanakae]
MGAEALAADAGLAPQAALANACTSVMSRLECQPGMVWLALQRELSGVTSLISRNFSGQTSTVTAAPCCCRCRREVPLTFRPHGREFVFLETYQRVSPKSLAGWESGSNACVEGVSYQGSCHALLISGPAEFLNPSQRVRQPLEFPQNRGTKIVGAPEKLTVAAEKQLMFQDKA